MVEVIIIALVIFVFLVVMYNIYQNPSFLKPKKREKIKVKPSSDPDRYIDDSKVSFKQKKAKVKQEIIEEPAKEIVEEIPTLEDNGVSTFDEMDIDELDKSRTSLAPKDDLEDDNIDELFDELFDDGDFYEDFEDSTDFVPYDAVDADSLDEEVEENDISKQIADLPPSIKAIMLSDILGKKKL